MAISSRVQGPVKLGYRLGTRMPYKTQKMGKILTRDEVRPMDLVDIAKGRATFLRIPKYIDSNVCETASQRLLDDHGIEGYSNAEGVNKIKGIGMAFFETTESEEKKHEYYKTAKKSFDATRELFSPYLSPLDKLRLEVDERWHHGSQILNLGEGKMFSGLMRVLSGQVLAHEDKLERDHGSLPEGLNYMAQLAVNIYLRTPKKGGELLSWDESLSTEEYDKRRGDSYGIDPKLCGKPIEVIKPEEGDLIFFNPRNLHAINPSEDQDRITISSFMIYSGKQKPFSFYS